MFTMTNSAGVSNNAKLLRDKASKQAIQGAIIAGFAVVIATILSSHFNVGEITLASMLATQKNNTVLWVLDAMPFFFPLWGQYVSSILSYEASAMVLDQTNELQAYTKALEQKANHDSTHDSLTNLPNRTLFIDRLQQSVNLASRENSQLAVCILDIDRFKEVNDTLGHYNGDRLIKQIALRLTGTIRESDTLARIGGDEFGFVLPKKIWKNWGKSSKRRLSRPFSWKI